MQALDFDYRDIIKAPRLAWSIRKMYVAFRGILIAWGIYIIFTYAALFLTPVGKDAGIIELFRRFELFPCVLNAEPGIIAFLVWTAGIFLVFAALLITATSVARIAFEDLRGNEVFQAKEAILFAMDHRGTVILSMAIIGMLVLLFLLIFGLLGVMGRIPFLGEFIVAFLSLPLFFWGLLGFLFFIVFMFGIALVPAIISCIGEDVLETIIQAVSSVYKQPLRLLFYEAVAKIIVALSSVILVIVSLITLHIMNVAFSICMGFKYSQMLTIGLYRFPYVMDSQSLVSTLSGMSGILCIPYIVDTSMASTTVMVAGWILGISQLLFFVWILSYSFSVFYSSQVLIYLAIRKHKNGDDLRLKSPVTHFVPENPETDTNK